MKLTATIALIAIAIGIVVFFIFRSVMSAVTILESRGINIQTLSEQCIIDYEVSPDISSLQCCRDSSGNITSMKYIPEYDLVVSNVARSYLTVCSQFCKNGVSEDQSSCIDVNGDPNIDLQQNAFEKCINLTKPTDCIGDVKPVAYQGNIEYYAYSAGNTLCKTTGVCNI